MTDYLKKREYHAVDFMKFLCAILVVTIHVAPLGHTERFEIVNAAVSNYVARLAVPFFFAASGFFLYRKSEQDSFDMASTWRYARRIAVLYLLWSAIYLPFIVRDILRNGSVLQGILLFARDFFLVASYRQLWYLPALIFAVVLTSALLKWGVKPGAIAALAAVCYVIGLLTNGYYSVLAPLNAMTDGKLYGAIGWLYAILGTTRNGLLDGFLFVAIGMLFAFGKVKLTRTAAWIGFVISLLLLGCEFMLIRRVFRVEAFDLMVMLPSATVCGFYLVLTTSVESGRYCSTLRTLSALLFYIHVWVQEALLELFVLLGSNLSESALFFWLVLGVSLGLSALIMALSKPNRLPWLRRLYA